MADKGTVSAAERDGAPDAGAFGTRAAGTCHVLLAFDVAMSIDLDAAQRRITEGASRTFLPQKRRTPRSMEYQPAPLRVTQAGGGRRIGGFTAADTVEITLFDFGAVSVAYRIGLDCTLDDLLTLSDALHGDEALIADARRRVEALLTEIGPAARRVGVSPFVEDYAIFQLDRYGPPGSLDTGIRARRATLAGILRAETAPMCEQEMAEALSARISFGPEDATLIDWNAALVMDPEADDVLLVLEYANVELLEMRFLDDRLDRVLDESYGALTGERWWHAFAVGRGRRDLHRLASLQADSALMFEGVNNALKLVGDPFLARVYRLAAGRLGLGDWDASIIRKLQTAESIYSKIADHRTTRRMEILEWIIIILIAVSILIAFVPGAGH